MIFMLYKSLLVLLICFVFEPPPHGFSNHGTCQAIANLSKSCSSQDWYRQPEFCWDPMSTSGLGLQELGSIGVDTGD